MEPSRLQLVRVGSIVEGLVNGFTSPQEKEAHRTGVKQGVKAGVSIIAAFRPSMDVSA